MNADVYRGPWGGSNCRDSLSQTLRTCNCPQGERSGYYTVGVKLIELGGREEGGVVREREGERGGEKERERETEREKDRVREREREGERESEKEMGGGRERLTLIL